MNKNLRKIEAGIILLFLIVPMVSPVMSQASLLLPGFLISRFAKESFDVDENLDLEEELTYQRYDTIYVPYEDVKLAGEQNDVGYNSDVGDKISRSDYLYVGEPVDSAPGRGRTGMLDPESGDDDDYYRFSLCEGLTITASISTSEDYELEILDEDEEVVSSRQYFTSFNNNSR
jgi:hypothetical protein